MERPVYLERALFVVSQPGGGKSEHLKNMFRDWRFGTKGNPWEKRGTIPLVALSNERTLLIFSQSAQEKPNDVKKWIKRVSRAIGSGRWCFAGALQAKGGDGLPDALEYIQAFIDAFAPERVRVCFLSPDHQQRVIGDFLDIQQVISAISSIDGAESVLIDDKLLNTNALMMADFFDFA